MELKGCFLGFCENGQKWGFCEKCEKWLKMVKKVSKMA
jgi:hypothetical protein